MRARIYDRIGVGYERHRRADGRLVHRLVQALGLPARRTVVELGAGTGSYSRALAGADLRVVAVEPSRVMLRRMQPHPNMARVAATAEETPLRGGSADGVVCILAAHHFTSPERAFREMARLCARGPLVVFTCDPRQADRPWLAEYFPRIWREAARVFPPLEEMADLLAFSSERTVAASAFELPHDLRDLFMAAGWRRPELYLDAEIRAVMSGFALADAAEVTEGVRRLRSDLESGGWSARHGWVRTRDRVDWGYRILRAGPMT